MPRHALDPSVAFGNDTESTIPWSSVSSSVAVLEYGPEDTADTRPMRSGRHRKHSRSIFSDPRFHAGATLGLMGTIFLPQISGAANGPATETTVNSVAQPQARPGSAQPDGGARGESMAQQRGTQAQRDAQPQRQPKHALREEKKPQQSPEQQLAGWTTRNSTIGVPARALQAYVNAEQRMAREQPDCDVRWNLLAGVGRIESNHGRFSGRQLQDDGQSSEKIIGIPLDGSAGVRAIYDTDGGEMDGDTVFDRAVGPMQFIPSTWTNWESDGNGDGEADPHSIDDAALASARYLCADGSQLDTEEGQRAALYRYNNSYEYGQDAITHAAAFNAGVSPFPTDVNPRVNRKAGEVSNRA